MTKEELKQEAEEYYENETIGTFNVCEECELIADAVQTAYIDSAEPREKRIAELEERNSNMRQSFEKEREYSQTLLKEIGEIKKENAELKCECRRCVYTDCPCILSDYGKDRNGICDHFKDVFDENIELKDELKKWKDEWQEQVQKATDEGYARTLQTIQLTKAKEFLEKFMPYVITSYLNQDISNIKLSFDEIKEAEQFLSEEK